MAFQYNESEFQETLEAGNMIACIKYLKKLHKVESVESIVCTSSFASTIGNMIQRFVKGTHIPVEYAEVILECVEKLIGSTNNDPKMLVNLAGNDVFITSNFKIIADYRTQIFKESPNYHELCSYSSHRCYETVLFLMVALVESSKILVVFIKALKIKRILELVNHLGKIILCDKSYVTQELALDVICRIYHYYSKMNTKVLPDILTTLPPSISKACSDVNVGTSRILQNMRPLLTEINKSNPNIHSLSLKSFYIQKELSSGGGDGDRYVSVDKFLDIEFERFTFSVMDEDSISYSQVKTTYQTIQQLHFDIRTFTMKVFLGFCSENLVKILTTDEKRSPEGFSPYLCFTFHDEQTMSTAKRLIEHQMSLREIVSHRPTFSADRTKMSVVSSRSASMVDAEAIARIGTKVGISEESFHQPLFGSELLGDHGGDVDEEPQQQQPEQQQKEELEQQHPVQEVIVHDPSIAATTSAPQDSPSSISSPDMNFGSAEDAIAPESTRSDKQTKTARQRRGVPIKAAVAAAASASKPVGVPMSLSYSLSHSRKGTATRSISRKADDSIIIADKENLPFNATALPNQLDDFQEEPAELHAMEFQQSLNKKQQQKTVPALSTVIKSTGLVDTDKPPVRRRGLSVLAEEAAPTTRQQEEEAVLPMPAPATTAFERPGTAKKKLLAAAAAAAAEKRRLSEEGVRLTQDSALTATKKPLLARMRFTPSKPSETAAPVVCLSPPMSPSNASVHTTNTTSSKRKYGKMAASITNASASQLQSNHDTTAKLFNFDGPGKKFHNSSSSNRQKKPSSSTSSNSIPHTDKNKGKGLALPGRDEKGVYKTPTTANLQKHNAFVSTTNLVFQPIQGLQYESDSERLSQKRRKLSQSPKKAKQQLAQARVREPSPPADYEQLTQPQGPEADFQGDGLYHLGGYGSVEDHEDEEEAQRFEDNDPMPVVSPIVVSKQSKALTPAVQQKQSEPSKSPEPLPPPKPPAAAAATTKAAHTQRPVTAIAKPEKKQLLKKLLGKEPAAAAAAAVAVKEASIAVAASAEKSKYFSDPFAGSRQSVRPLKLQAASSSTTTTAAVVVAKPKEKGGGEEDRPAAPLTQAPKTRSTKRSAEIPPLPLQPPPDADDNFGMDNDGVEPPLPASVAQTAKQPLFTPPAKVYHPQQQQSTLNTSGLTTAATASTSLLTTSASAQSISQDITAVAPTSSTHTSTAIWRCHLQPKQPSHATADADAEAESAAQVFLDVLPKGPATAVAPYSSSSSSAAMVVANKRSASSAMFALSVPDGNTRGGKTGKGRVERNISQETVSYAEKNAVSTRRRHASDDNDNDDDEEEDVDVDQVDSDADSDGSYRKGPPARPSKGAANKGRRLNSHRSHGRVVVSAKGKKSAAAIENDDGDEEEEEEVDGFEATQRSSDDDQEIVLQMLIQELLRFKEEREQRRRESAVRRVVSQASAAMEAFLRQAAEFADSSCADSKALAMAKLQTISATAEEVFTAIVHSSENLSSKGASMRERQEKLAAETAALVAEASAAWAQCRSEETQLRSDLLEKKRLARAAVSKLRGTRSGAEAGAGAGAGGSKRKKQQQQQQENDDDDDDCDKGYGGGGSSSKVGRSKRQKNNNNSNSNINNNQQQQQLFLEAMHQM